MATQEQTPIAAAIVSVSIALLKNLLIAPFLHGLFSREYSRVGRTPKGAYSSRGRSRDLLETAFSEPLLRTLLTTLLNCKTHSRPPSQNPSENPFPRTLPRTFSEPFLERCVAVRPLRRAPKRGKRPIKAFGETAH